MKIISFNKIQNHIFQLDSKSYLSIGFKIISFNWIQNRSDNKPIEQKAALHLAVEKENIEIIKLLLENKYIDINIKDGKGKKPIDYSENHDIKQLLSKWFSIHFKIAINKNQLHSSLQIVIFWYNIFSLFFRMKLRGKIKWEKQIKIKENIVDKDKMCRPKLCD